MIEVEIDKGSGFCFGVVTAIESAERELKNTNTLYCLGDIVHNSLEVERLEKLGLRTIGHDEFTRLKGEKVLLRGNNLRWSDHIFSECRKLSGNCKCERQ